MRPSLWFKRSDKKLEACAKFPALVLDHHLCNLGLTLVHWRKYVQGKKLCMILLEWDTRCATTPSGILGVLEKRSYDWTCSAMTWNILQTQGFHSTGFSQHMSKWKSKAKPCQKSTATLKRNFFEDYRCSHSGSACPTCFPNVSMSYLLLLQSWRCLRPYQHKNTIRNSRAPSESSNKPDLHIEPNQKKLGLIYDAVWSRYRLC